MRSNGVCTQVWSLSNWGTGEIGKSRSFLGSMLIPWPGAESSCWLATSSRHESARRVQAANRWKKNARGDRAYRKVDGIRDCRRSDDGVEMVPENAAQYRRSASFVWRSGEP